jgi:hypothetical protein
VSGQIRAPADLPTWRKSPYLLNRSLDGPHRRSARFVKEKNVPFPTGNLTPNRPSQSLVTVQAVLFRPRRVHKDTLCIVRSLVSLGILFSSVCWECLRKIIKYVSRIWSSGGNTKTRTFEFRTGMLPSLPGHDTVCCSRGVSYWDSALSWTWTLYRRLVVPFMWCRQFGRNLVYMRATWDSVHNEELISLRIIIYNFMCLYFMCGMGNKNTLKIIVECYNKCSSQLRPDSIWYTADAPPCTRSLHTIDKDVCMHDLHSCKQLQHL